MSATEHSDVFTPRPEGSGTEIHRAARSRAKAAERYRLDVVAGKAPPVEVWPRHRTDCKSFAACAAALSASGRWRCPPPAPYFAGCPDLDVKGAAVAAE